MENMTRQQMKECEQRYDQLQREYDDLVATQVKAGIFAEQSSMDARNAALKTIADMLMDAQNRGCFVKFHTRRKTHASYITLIPEAIADKKFECGLKRVPFDKVKNKQGGDCTIRMNAWLTKVDYDTIFAEQKEWCHKKYKHLDTKGNMRGKWREWGVWYMPLLSRGYRYLKLEKNMQANTLVKKLKKATYQPFCFVANDHVAVVDNGNVVDSWDSRRKVVRAIVAKPEDVKTLKQMLNCKEFTKSRMYMDAAPAM